MLCQNKTKKASFGGRDTPRPEHVKHSQAQGEDIEKEEHSDYKIDEHHQG